MTGSEEEGNTPGLGGAGLAEWRQQCRLPHPLRAGEDGITAVIGVEGGTVWELLEGGRVRPGFLTSDVGC